MRSAIWLTTDVSVILIAIKQQLLMSLNNLLSAKHFCSTTDGILKVRKLFCVFGSFSSTEQLAIFPLRSSITGLAPNWRSIFTVCCSKSKSENFKPRISPFRNPQKTPSKYSRYQSSFDAAFKKSSICLYCKL